jgi:hypothetical protein
MNKSHATDKPGIVLVDSMHCTGPYLITNVHKNGAQK